MKALFSDSPAEQKKDAWLYVLHIVYVANWIQNSQGSGAFRLRLSQSIIKRGIKNIQK